MGTYPMSGQLLDERSVAVQPSLVRALGITRAIILQQIHWHSREHHGEELDDGFEWVALPLDRFADETGLSVDQCRRAVAELEQREVVMSVQPEGYVRTKWYRVNLGHALFVADCPSGKSAGSMPRNSRFQAAESPPLLYKKDKTRSRSAQDPDPPQVAAARAQRERGMASVDAIDAEFQGVTEVGLGALAEIKERLRGGKPKEAA